MYVRPGVFQEAFVRLGSRILYFCQVLMLKFVEEFQRDDSEDDQASREEPNVSEGCRKAFIDDFFRRNKTAEQRN